MHLFASTVLQFKTYPVEDQYGQDSTYDKPPVTSGDEIGKTKVLANSVATCEEGDRQNDEHSQKSQFDIGAKDREQLAELQRHDGAPGRPPDEKKGDYDFDDGISHIASAKLEAWATKPEGFDRNDGSHCQCTANPEWIGDPVQHGS